MPVSTPTQTMNDKEARLLGRQIAKESNTVRVKYGKVNGNAVLHVFVPGENTTGRTIKNAAEWGSHPANDRMRKQRNEIKDETEAQEDDLVITHTNAEASA